MGSASIARVRRRVAGAQAALLDEVTRSSEDSETIISTLSSRYRVSTQVIGYQLENAGVGGMA